MNAPLTKQKGPEPTKTHEYYQHVPDVPVQKSRFRQASLHRVDEIPSLAQWDTNPEPQPPPPCRRHLRVVDCRSFLRHKQHRLLSARLQTEREAEPPQVPAVAASALLAGPSEDLRVGMSDVCRVEVGFRNLVVCRPIFALLLSKHERADVSRNFGCS